MRFIYTDEAGTGANEPVTVVIGIVVNADTQWVPARDRIFQALETVPESLRQNFVFHATEVWSQKYKANWSKEDRLQFLKTMMTIPRDTGLAISYGVFYRDGLVNPNANLTTLAMTREQYQHAYAFGMCMASADDYINTYGSSNEVAAIVAEDIPEMRRSLKEATTRLRIGSVTIRNSLITQQVLGRPVASKTLTLQMQIRRMIDDIHFASKDSSVMLWLADAVAYGLRRYYADLPFGVDFARAIIGPDLEPATRSKHCACGYMCSEKLEAAPLGERPEEPGSLGAP